MSDNDKRQQPPPPDWAEKGQRGPNVPIPDWVPTTTQPTSAVPPAPANNDKK